MKFHQALKMATNSTPLLLTLIPCCQRVVIFCPKNDTGHSRHTLTSIQGQFINAYIIQGSAKEWSLGWVNPAS